METCHQRKIRETTGVQPMLVSTFDKGVVKKLSGDMSFGRIPIPIGRAFIEKYEWLGHVGRALIHYGMWKDTPEGRLLYGVECFTPLPYGFAKSLGETGKKSLMLSRGACALAAGRNGASMLISACLRDLRQRGYSMVVAHADPRAGESGGAYRAANGQYGGKTHSKRRYYFYKNQWMQDLTLWRMYRMKVKDLPLDTPRRTDQEPKLRYFWLLNERARQDLPTSWFGNIFVPFDTKIMTVDEALSEAPKPS